MATNQTLRLFRVYDERSSISAVANTITASFAQDPLITWLRPRVPPWRKDNIETYKWQYRRVQRAVADGIVLQSAPNNQILQSFSPISSESCRVEADVKGSVPEESRSEDGDDDMDAGVVALLFPPQRHQKWTFARFVLQCKLLFLDTFCARRESGTNTQRVDIMMNSHDETIERVKKLYRLSDVWYLEVVAVHPSLQGRSLGKKAMTWVLDYINHEPILLECTSESNIPFYQKLGFEVVQEVELRENGEAVKLWFMLRQESRSGHSK
ncbi:hypothetical protein AbraIFM66951_002591 [Aspergillus brasiliensis]|uniref:N-acetyltransferase domain-containing protein n=1 Tax=Aspergillus brasiliensis TaxID=319629 RepID=A0A9W6DSV3_9EURO|nr:hypothetical protein AbraCBS73388_002598 [Aspergillus brasiliensis]GKZ49882.1 hypothetical protein AbraIFM66951_002591 [Aspergillus brasiliensis]